MNSENKTGKSDFGTKTFKYFNLNFLKEIKNRLKTLHELFKKEQVEYNGQTLYQVLSQWLLDITQYGFILEIIHIAFTGWHGWKTLLWVLAFGFMWWFSLDYIASIKDRLSE